MLIQFLSLVLCFPLFKQPLFEIVAKVSAKPARARTANKAKRAEAAHVCRVLPEQAGIGAHRAGAYELLR